MFDFLKKRLSEPSTFAGLAAMILGAGELGKIREAPAVADAITGAGQAIASGMDPITAGIITLGGLAAVFLGENGK